ncbi:hypothetical protein J4714_08595 [Staphylococcus epidermidis]|nr:hypothetical protein [Staphylococcus epidermidis]
MTTRIIVVKNKHILNSTMLYLYIIMAKTIAFVLAILLLIYLPSNSRGLGPILLS